MANSFWSPDLGTNNEQCLQLVEAPETWGLEDELPFSEGSFAAGLWSVRIIALRTVLPF